MVCKNFYIEEKRLFPKENHTPLYSHEEIEEIVNKLVKHEGLYKVKVVFQKNRRKSAYIHKNPRIWYEFGLGSEIHFPYYTKKYGVTVLSTIHEVAHHYEYSRHGETKHAKSLLNAIKRIREDFYQYYTLEVLSHA